MRRLSANSPRTVAESLARKAGSLIKSHLAIGASRTWKADHTPVTAIDKQINTLVLDTIHARFPDHSILAEEESDLTQSKEFVWVCDPLDGTFPFMHGIPVSTFSLALVHNGQPILGVIYDPFTDRMFVAEKDMGASLNDHPIHTSSTSTLNDTSIGVVFWKGNMQVFTPLLAKLAESGGKIFDLVSIAYMDAMVAAGEFGAVIFPGESAHDSAAAKIIVEEAGGVFTSLTGVVDRYDQPVHGHIAAANQEIYDQISSLLR
jgi:fructose-1,6-bisphosphatase/inositol monophosphatase family enzyme